MSAAQHPVRVEPEPRQSRLRQALWVWLLTGGMLILLGPMRGQSLWFGWLPFWATVWPAMSLILLRCCRVASSRARLVAPRQATAAMRSRTTRAAVARGAGGRIASPRPRIRLRPA